MAHDVFIAYSFDDQKIVDELTAYLERNDVSCFVANRDIPKGKSWAKYLPPAIENCKMMLYVHSETANKSEDIENEIALCLENKHPILPFKISDTKYTGDKKYNLVRINWIDAFPNPKDHFEKLITSTRKILEEEKIRLEKDKLQKENEIQKKEIERLKTEVEELKEDQQANKKAKKDREAEERALEEAKEKKEVEEKAAKEAITIRIAAEKAVEEAQAKRETKERAAAEAIEKKEAEERAAEKAKLEKEAEVKAAAEAREKRLAEKKAMPKAIVIGGITAVVLFLLFIVISKYINGKKQDLNEQNPIVLNTNEQNAMIQNPMVHSPLIQELINNMVLVQGGAFTMGCTDEQGSDCWDDENPAHQVTVSSFYIGKYEVTQAQWKAVMGSDKDSSTFKGDYLPVEQVRWDEAQEFIGKLNAQTGKQYRLPTEAEWEFAARGGVGSEGFKYSGSDAVDDVAWYGKSKGSYIVGSKQANERGLYDMSGNVWEWCNDWYDKDYYKNSPSTNPKGPVSGSFRVIRGGSWYSNARNARVSCRYFFDPAGRGNNIGFRLASGSN